MEPLIKAEEVEYHYPGPSGPIEALEGVNLSIAPGEHVALIGPNGSGKSTLLKLFNALLLPTGGKIMVGGRTTSDSSLVWEIRQDCGMVFQNPDNQMVATTVEEDVAFGLENLQLSHEKIRARVWEVLQNMNLSRWSQHAPHLLSGGQKQRVALAGVMAMCPRCLLLDEATSQLDLQGKTEVISSLHNLNQQEGITLVNVTHFPEEAALADRVIVLYRGRVVKDGKAPEVLSNEQELESWGLEPPPAVFLNRELKKRGMPLPENLITIEQLVNQICSWK